jgi:tetratricopeptide (TPR) repeat protein
LYGYSKQRIKPKEFALITGLLVAYILQNQLVFDWIGTYLGLFTLVAISTGYLNKEDNLATGQINFKKYFHSKILYIIITISIISGIGWIMFVLSPVAQAKLMNTAIGATVQERTALYSKIFNSPYMRGSAGFFAGYVHTSYNKDLSTDTFILNNKEIVVTELNTLIHILEKTQSTYSDDYRFFLSGIKLINLEMFISKNKTQEKINLANNFFEKTKELSPNNVEGYIEFSETLVFAGMYREAIETAVKALELNPRYITAHINLINILQAVATPESVEKAVLNAKKYFPNYQVQ